MWGTQVWCPSEYCCIPPKQSLDGAPTSDEPSVAFDRLRLREPLYLAVLSAVGEVDDLAEDQPAGEADPGGCIEREHQRQRDDDSADRHQGNEGRTERAMQVGLLDAHDPDTEADDGECEKRAEADEFAEKADGEERREECGECPDHDGRDVGRTKT